MSHIVTMFSAWGTGELATAAAIAVTVVLLHECIMGARIHDGSAVTIKCTPCTVTVRSNTDPASVVVYHSVSPVSPSSGTPGSDELNKHRAVKSHGEPDEPEKPEKPDEPGEPEEEPGEPEEEPGEPEEEPEKPEAASDTTSEVPGELESELDPVLVRFVCGDA